MMDLLILGGTVFLGRHLVELASARHHHITLFNRGQHNPGLFPEVDRIIGDRDGGLEALRGRTWDAVIDTSGYLPRLVAASAKCLAGSVGQYAFISTISVYSDPPIPAMDEQAPLCRLADETTEQINGETYGGLKVLCEHAVEDVFHDRTLIIRPGLIVGPHDPSDRFTYWPARVGRGGEVLAPVSPSYLTQFIDVRDLADWTLSMVEERQTGVFNATGPDYPLSLGELLACCREVTRSDAAFTWVSDMFLLDCQVGSFEELPLWVPMSDAAWNLVNASRAISHGLKFRPLRETVSSTWLWDQSRPPTAPRRNGLSPDREVSLLQAWHALIGK